MLLLFCEKQDQGQPRGWCLPAGQVGELSAGEGGSYCLQDMQMIYLLHHPSASIPLTIKGLLVSLVRLGREITCLIRLPRYLDANKVKYKGLGCGLVSGKMPYVAHTKPRV